MAELSFSTHGWGPEGCPAAMSITFDNLGEAAEIELGGWGDRPVGAHHTIDFIPRLIEVLGSVRTTYFMEASNVALYPEAITTWHAAGHEVGIHAWRHENWGRTAPNVRRELLSRSLAAFRSLGIDAVGFRPPGGPVEAAAWREFEDAGLLYCSAAGAPVVGRIGNVVSVPFAWRLVDVYMIEKELGFMRVGYGDPEDAYSIDTWRAELEQAVRSALAEGGHRTVIFHPNFLGTSPEKLEVLRHLISLATANDMWLAPVGDVARFADAKMASLAQQAA